MPPEARAAAAAISAAIVNESKYSSVYSYATGEYVNVDANASAGQLKAYDWSRSASIEGRLPSSVYDYSDSSFYEYKHNGQGKISGYHYGTGSFFDVTVKGKSVSIYDYQVGNYFEFSVS